jgi:endonuclease/exonuclease/phosphatase family metal-dependent hydrolase
MPKLRVLSWNIRTFGSHIPNAADLRRIADIILQSQADIVCIQELMIGSGVVGVVGAPISPRSIGIVEDLVIALHEADLDGRWWHACSGVNAGEGEGQRDAYAFVWKERPNKSKFAHPEAPDAILDLSEPVILRQMGNDNFPGRRPGMFIVNVQAGQTVTPVNVISYHAPTPCNRFSNGVGSGYGINALATLPEIGGGVQQGDGHNWSYQSSVMPLPQIDTIVLGDFNYTMDDRWASFTYNNLLTNYQACVSDPGHVQLTTYAQSGTEALRLISAYDNIFVLRKHSEFTPSLNFSSCGVIDFIAQDAKILGQAVGFRDFGTEAAWYVIHLDQYKKQHARNGLSDHLPVWAEFTIGALDATAKKILPTSGADNNCLLHAVFGAVVDGLYVDTDAAAHREQMVAQLNAYRTAREIPTGANLTPVRNAILASMINEFDGEPLATTMLRQLLAGVGNPFLDPEFDELFGLYIMHIELGRMLYVHEAELLACLLNITVVLNYVNRGRFYQMLFNDGRPNPVNIYHQALHFSRWAP